MATIYRVQDKDGRGPFKPGFSHKWAIPRYEQKNLPTWAEEFGIKSLSMNFGYHVGCGCLTLDQLRRWFAQDEYAALLRLGYRAVKMDADRILAQSDVQCLFERRRALRKGVTTVRLYEED